MDPQTSSTVLLCRPAAFGFNAEAARSNAFAADPGSETASAALAEFDALVAALERAGVTSLILDDNAARPCPDAVFPNNWVSFHADGTMVLYPMSNASRRPERRPEAVRKLAEGHGLEVRRIVDLSHMEADGHHLEGTGSLILDRPARAAFAARSERTSEQAVRAFDAALGFTTCLFDAADRHGRAIYHTNVLLSLGTRLAVICSEALAPDDRDCVLRVIESGGRTIVDVNFAQMERFACNIIELASAGGDPVLAMSSSAHDAFTPDQRRQLETLGGNLVEADIPTIERVGGGSVRCMIADVHLPAAT